MQGKSKGAALDLRTDDHRVLILLKAIVRLSLPSHEYGREEDYSLDRNKHELSLCGEPDVRSVLINLRAAIGHVRFDYRLSIIRWVYDHIRTIVLTGLPRHPTFHISRISERGESDAPAPSQGARIVGTWVVLVKRSAVLAP